MTMLSRRAVLTSVGTSACIGLLPRAAKATLARGMALEELVGRSDHCVVGTAQAARCVHLTLGGRRLLVTETQLRVEGIIALRAPRESTVVVRTLGGQLDGTGELVSGQAELRSGQQCAAFLETGPDRAYWVTGMSQGHYPLVRTGSALVLRESPQLPRILDWERCAVKKLVGVPLSQAERLIADAMSR